MAKGKKTGGKDWKPGEGGPGRPRKPADLVAAQKLTKTEITGKLIKFMAMSVDELAEILRDKSLPVLDHFIGRVALLGIHKGDQQRLNFIFERLIGKVKDNVEISVKPKIIHNLDGGSVELLMEGKEDDET